MLSKLLRAANASMAFFPVRPKLLSFYLLKDNGDIYLLFCFWNVPLYSCTLVKFDLNP